MAAGAAAIEPGLVHTTISLLVGAAAAAKGWLVLMDAFFRGCRRSYIMTGEYVSSAPVNRALAAT